MRVLAVRNPHRLELLCHVRVSGVSCDQYVVVKTQDELWEVQNPLRWSTTELSKSHHDRLRNHKRFYLTMLAPFVSTFSRIRSPSGLAVVLDRIRDNLSHRVLFYSIGTDANTDVQDIEDAVKNLSRSSRTSVGCLTRRLSSSEQTISLSLAAFDEDVCTVFSSTEVDDEIVQVGRWHSSTGRGVAENAGVPWDLKFPNGGFEDGDYWERAKRQRTSCPVPGELEALNAR